ncbi:phage tail family protein [Halobacillus kuroshimensis]|uniref:Phage tail family protein n=1 Tax=Halobacillus kuroshimensis TaxID=302481 RepID=A0ABS3E005_9BACI|nr:phage tail domain-containing protein [Halobacillus kuroshimensis]MBN8236828.1 phage tail family protein [Halobacillus kuroshimensis]
MKSDLNFRIIKDGSITDMYDLGIWVESFHIFSPNITREKLQVAGHPGAYLLESNEEERQVSISMQVEADSLKAFDDLKHRIYELFFSREAFVITRDLTPDRKIKVLQEGDYDIDQITTEDGKFQINLTMLDPYLYGDEEEALFSEDTLLLYYEGTAPTYPIFEIEVLEDITHLDMIKSLEDELEFMRIGRPPIASEEEYERETLVLHDSCSTLNGWTQAGAVDNGYVDGNFMVEGNRFTPELFSAAQEPYKWQGPSIKRSIGKALSSYKIDVLVELVNVAKGTGMMEVYLLDANNNVIAKIGVEDIWRTMDKIQAKFQLGNVGEDRYQDYREPAYPWGWNNFKGLLRLWSHDHYEGGKRRIRPYFALIEPDGTHNWVSSSDLYIGPSGKYDNPITQVQFASRIWAPTNTKADMYFDDLKVYEINPAPVEGVQWLAKAGDKIVIDTKEEDILLNGESIKKERSLGSEFFSLDPGLNMLVQYPQQSVRTKIFYEPAYR